jgi:chemotaxis protein MotB
MMRKLLLCAAFLISTNSLISQELYLESGKTIVSFDYYNELGVTLDNIHASSHTFLTVGFRKNLWTEHLYYNANASFNGYGAIGSDRAFDNYFEWDLNYLGIGFGLDYQFYRPGNFSFYIKAFASVEFLIQGTQTLNNQVYNLYREKDFDGAMFNLRPGLGVQYKISENLTVFSQYTYGVSNTFKNISGNLKIKTDNVGIGVLLNISKNVSAETKGIDEAQLEQIRMELDANAQKIQVLEEKSMKMEALKKEIVLKDKEIERLKTSIYNALYPYKGSELNMEDRQGKIYITLENDLLFKTGSSDISKEGKQALNDLGNILAQNPNVAVLIQGHTDNQPYKDANMTNRDLSLQRATAVVNVLSKNPNINQNNLVAAGIGEFEPIADNATEEGQSKNRRIEIILTPELTELIKIIKN